MFEPGPVAVGGEVVPIGTVVSCVPFGSILEPAFSFTAWSVGNIVWSSR